MKDRYVQTQERDQTVIAKSKMLKMKFQQNQEMQSVHSVIKIGQLNRDSKCCVLKKGKSILCIVYIIVNWYPKEGSAWRTGKKTLAGEWWVTFMSTYIDLCVDDVNKTAEDNDEIKHIPWISKIVLKIIRYAFLSR